MVAVLAVTQQEEEVEEKEEERVVGGGGVGGRGRKWRGVCALLGRDRRWAIYTWQSAGRTQAQESVLKICTKNKISLKNGLNRDLNPGPLAPKARIIPLDH